MPDLIVRELVQRTSGEGNERQRQRAVEILRQIITRQLTAKQRTYLTMYYGREMTMTEIAEEVGVSLSTATRTLQRARKRIQDRMCYYDFRGSGG